MSKLISGLAAVMVLAAGPALAGPIAATLEKPVSAPTKKVVSSVVFSCAKETCVSVSDAQHVSAKRVCRDLVKWTGPVTAFSTSNVPLSSEDLAACNKS